MKHLAFVLGLLLTLTLPVAAGGAKESDVRLALFQSRECQKKA